MRRLCMIPRDYAAFNAKNPNNEHYAHLDACGCEQCPEEIDVFNEFVHALCSRYKGRLHAIEVGNELQLTCWSIGTRSRRRLWRRW